MSRFGRLLRRRPTTLGSSTTDATLSPPQEACCAHGSMPFQMNGCRTLLESYEDSLPIRSAIEVIERSIPADPGIAYTHCRGLFETVCKTILTDLGVDVGENARPNWLVSQALKALKLTPDTFDDDDRVESGVEDVFRGLSSLMNGVVALRKSQGIGPHGRDALEAVLDADYAIVVAHAVDSAASLLYRLHRTQGKSDPLKRIRFGDYPQFDAYIDGQYPNLEVEETPIQASKALCLVDPEAYRQRLVAFLSDPSQFLGGEEFAEGEELSEEADG